METKRTPGPWIIETYSVVASNTPVDGGDIICEAPLIFEDSMRRWQANARLIAAAPELLAACSRAFNLIKESGFSSGLIEEEFDGTLNQLDAAIAKVEGR